MPDDPNEPRYRQPSLADIHYTLGKVDGKLNQLANQLSIQDARNENHHAEMEHRIRNVEAKQFWLAGAGSMLSAIAAYFVRAKVG